MTGKRQIMVDSIWIDKESAQKFIKFMKKLQGSSPDATIYKIKELKLDTVSDFIFRPHTGTLSVRFTRDSVNCYGDFLKDHYYSLDVANGHGEPIQPFNRVNKTYLSLTGIRKNLKLDQQSKKLSSKTKKPQINEAFF